jgi:Domain of unknown function (DUF4424)
MRNRNIGLAFAVAAACVIAVASARAQTKPAGADAANTPSAPAESSLTVGALQVGSAANLALAAFDIHVERDSVVYSYFFKNTGSAEVAVTAAVSLPELTASGDRSETWVLSVNDPENPVGLTITAAGAAVTTTAHVHADALGFDRLAEIKAEHLPLIPFGPEIDKALAALSPEAADRLAALGLISPRAGAQKSPPTADWSLSVVRTWRAILPAGKTTPIVVKFSPVKAQYRMAKGSEQDLEDMKDDICLKPPMLSALQARLKTKGVWKVTDISLSVEAPSSSLDNPKRTLSALKPTAEAIVTFCGLDEKTAGKQTVLGTVPDDNNELRVVIFEPVAN